jgi:hypothetical protein
VEVDSKGGVVIEDRNKDSKPEVTFVPAVEVSSVLKGRMVGALGLNKNNRSDCDSSEVIANEEVTYSFLPTSSQSFSTAISQSSVSVRIPAMSLSQTTLDSTTTSELSAKSAKGIETSVFAVTGSDSQDITPSRPIGVRSNIDDIFPLTLENEYVTSSFAITSELSQSDLLFGLKLNFAK